MAIPVADAQEPEVNTAFDCALRDAWQLSKHLRPGQTLDWRDIGVESASPGTGRASDGGCFVYPEVSANVQAFVRSRVSREGVYLFCDTGAGTVDQSLFIFYRNGDSELLTYLAAAVLPLGSSELERRASACDISASPDLLERLRSIKERGIPHPLLDGARDGVAEELTAATKRTLVSAKRKLRWKGQLCQTRLIFGGGGHCEHPYTSGPQKAFRSEIFARQISPDIVGIPKPSDLELPSRNHRWLNRLTVAYGLSFPRSALVRFIYPVDVDEPEPEEIWQPIRRRGHAPGKDEV